MKLKSVVVAALLSLAVFLPSCATTSDLDVQEDQLRTELRAEIEESHLTTKIEMRTYNFLRMNRLPVLNVSLERVDGELAWEGTATILYGKGIIALPVKYAQDAETGRVEFHMGQTPAPADNWAEEVH